VVVTSHTLRDGDVPGFYLAIGGKVIFRDIFMPPCFFCMDNP
jgi:hypothetical protein